jgi:glycosyltransferase involved in cell wall biosynthesis
MRAFAVPGDLSAPTGGYGYDRQVLRALPDLVHLPLPDGFPFPSEANLHVTADRLAAVPPGSVLLIDGLALGALPGWCLDRVRAPVVALVHHPLFLETGLSNAVSDSLRQSEQKALSRAAHVVVTSAETSRFVLQAFGVPADRLSVAEPGTEPAERAVGGGMPPRLLAVGSVLPRKGYSVLVTALGGLANLPWTLTIAGALDRDTVAVADLRAAIAGFGLAGRITLAGAVDAAALSRLYAGADIFVSASFYEGYGMAVAEAMARGLPLVAAAGGALAETIPAGAALLCPPNDAGTLRRALARMLTDDAVRAACAAASWSAGQRLPRWEKTAQAIAQVLDRVAAQGWPSSRGHAVRPSSSSA